MYDFPLIFRIPQPYPSRTPMALTREQIESIASLARLELTTAELSVYQTSLSSIL